MSIKSKGLLLGFSKIGEYEDNVIQLAKGEQIYLTTDGITDSRAKTLESFGEHRLYEIIKMFNQMKIRLKLFKRSLMNLRDQNTMMI